MMNRLDLRSVDQELAALFGAQRSIICQFCGRVVEQGDAHTCADEMPGQWFYDLAGNERPKYGRALTYVVE